MEGGWRRSNRWSIEGHKRPNGRTAFLSPLKRLAVALPFAPVCTLLPKPRSPRYACHQGTLRCPRCLGCLRCDRHRHRPPAPCGGEQQCLPKRITVAHVNFLSHTTWVEIDVSFWLILLRPKSSLNLCGAELAPTSRPAADATVSCSARSAARRPTPPRLSPTSSASRPPERNTDVSREDSNMRKLTLEVWNA